MILEIPEKSRMVNELKFITFLEILNGNTEERIEDVYGIRQRCDAQPSQTANWNSLPNKSPLYMCEHDDTTYSQGSLAISLSRYSLPGMSHVWLWTCRESQYCFTRRRAYRMRHKINVFQNIDSKMHFKSK